MAGVQPGLTMVVGPPGTGKTDTAVQIMNVLYHNCPGQRTLLITHSNQVRPGGTLPPTLGPGVSRRGGAPHTRTRCAPECFDSIIDRIDPDCGSHVMVDASDQGGGSLLLSRQQWAVVLISSPDAVVSHLIHAFPSGLERPLPEDHAARHPIALPAEAG